MAVCALIYACNWFNSLAERKGRPYIGQPTPIHKVGGLGLETVKSSDALVKLGPDATLKVQPGFLVGGSRSAKRLLRRLRCFPTGREIAVVVHPASSLVVVFEWWPVGHLKADPVGLYVSRAARNFKMLAKQEREIRRTSDLPDFMYEREWTQGEALISLTSFAVFREDKTKENLGWVQHQGWIRGRRGVVRMSGAHPRKLAPPLSLVEIHQRVSFAPGAEASEHRAGEPTTSEPLVIEGY